MPQVVRREDGVTLAELLAALAILLVLVSIAIPTFFGNVNQARDAETKSELRQALAALKTVNLDAPTAPDLETRILELSPSVKLDAAAVTGIKVERAPDDSICLWRISESGRVYGLWESPFTGVTLYAKLGSLPAACPDASAAAGAGFVAGGW